jgi:hypothetical protein
MILFFRSSSLANPWTDKSAIRVNASACISAGVHVGFVHWLCVPFPAGKRTAKRRARTLSPMVPLSGLSPRQDETLKCTVG